MVRVNTLVPGWVILSKLMNPWVSLTYTFCSNSKYSLLGLLCTLARLYEGTPLQPLRLNIFGINFLLYPISQFPFLVFHGQEGQHKKVKGIHSPWSRSAHQPSHPRDITPRPNLPLIPCQGKLHTVPIHFNFAAQPLKNVSLAFCGIHTHRVLPSLFSRREKEGGGGGGW